MKIEQAAKALKNLLEDGRILAGAPMREHTTFQTGGPADLMALPSSEEEIAGVLRIAAECGLPVVVIGRGSNLIVRDGGVRGLVVKLADNFSEIRVQGETVVAQAGATLSALVRAAHAQGLCGMECAGGIPGSVGGAVVMNAGAYGGEIGQNTVSVRLLDKDLRVAEADNAAMRFSYRASMAAETGSIVLSAVFRMERGDIRAAKALLWSFNRKRRDKQPLDRPSAGSIFKRPQGQYASALIEKAGLKGLRAGGARVSEKHAGFIVNAGGASSADILSLIETVRRRVFESSGVLLETEVKIIGEDLPS